MKIKLVAKLLLVYFAVAFVVFLSAYLFPATAAWGNSVPTVVSVLLLVPIYAWYRSYGRDTKFSEEVVAGDRVKVLLWVFTLFILAMSVRIPSVLVFGAAYEKTPLILLTVLTIVVVERTEASAFGFTTGMFGKSLVYGLAFFLVLNVSAVVVGNLLTYVFLNRMAFRSFDPLPFLAAMPFMTLCVGVSEEGFFRGYVQTRLEKLFTPESAIMTQALLFGAWHFVWDLSPFNPSGMVQYMATTFLIGLSFGYFYHRTRNLTPLVFAHGLWDSVALAIVENQLVFNTLDAVSRLGYLLVSFMPYIISSLLTFFFVRYSVRRMDAGQRIV